MRPLLGLRTNVVFHDMSHFVIAVIALEAEESGVSTGIGNNEP
jgi:hypothetical protein